MLELKIAEMQELKPIDFNFEELKKELSEQLERYQNVVYTDETIKIATEDRAKLNKLSKAINDRKIEIHKEYDKPYSEFEAKIKIILGMINEPLSLIDKQIKDFEQKEKDEKLQEITQYFASKVGKFEGLINFDKIYNEKWLNKTYKMTTIESDIEHIIKKTESDLSVIDGQIKEEMINKQVKDYYFKNIGNASVLSMSLQEGIRITEANQKLAELNKKEEKRTESVQNITNQQKKKVKFEVVVENKQQTMAIQQCLQDNNIAYKILEVEEI